MDLKNKDKVRELLSLIGHIDSICDVIDILKKIDCTESTCYSLGYNLVSVMRYCPSLGKELKSHLDNIKNDIKEQLKDL